MHFLKHPSCPNFQVNLEIPQFKKFTTCEGQGFSYLKLLKYALPYQKGLCQALRLD